MYVAWFTIPQRTAADVWRPIQHTMHLFVLYCYICTIYFTSQLRYTEVTCTFRMSNVLPRCINPRSSSLLILWPSFF